MDRLSPGRLEEILATAAGARVLVVGDLMLELHERLSLSELTQGRSYELPITQETLADALGLTAVHVNRMLQAARRAGDLIWSTRSMTIPDPKQLARKVGRAAVKVVAP